jgi:hypothetical protein
LWGCWYLAGGVKSQNDAQQQQQRRSTKQAKKTQSHAKTTDRISPLFLLFAWGLAY